MSRRPPSLSPSLPAKVLAMMSMWKKKSEEKKISFVGLPTDIIILVMGSTGVGKSTFIHDYTKDDLVSVGHELESCTHEVTSYHAPMPTSYAKLWNRRLILVDTPGFDDSRGNDVDILQKVSGWLVQAYKQELPVAGIVYITDITQKRMNGTAKLNLSMFTKLCGESSYKKVMMATSHWQELPDQRKGATREAELIGNYWKDIMDGGARVRRIDKLDGNYEEVIIQDVIKGFLDCEGKEEGIQPLLIQYELVEWHRTLPTTQAGKELRSTLQEILELKKRAEAGKMDEKMRRELEAKKASLRKQLKTLKLPLSQRIRGALGIATGAQERL
ncbi:hypothetical protein BKA70DRAFT_1291452 [Coprinopsis sp. MPI-PUGE-AT-0042]|nr:hypothetical protein BKA70DRAFT_1291452 [Coprinopsis sp. MPI-PUGE-AT-0042]